MKIKGMILVMLALIMTLTMTACMNSADEQPQTTADGSFAPDGMNMNATQPPVAFDWVTGSGNVETAVNGISEIADSRVVVTGTTALVGVRFDDAYKGEVTERIRQMVAAEVLKADPSIQTVAVTAQNEDVQKIYAISDALRTGTPAENTAEQINAIVRNATTLR